VGNEAHLVNILHVPHRPEESGDAGFSMGVADALTEAYRHVGHVGGRFPGRRKAEAILGPLEHAPKSARQAMRVLYVLGGTRAARGEFTLALERLVAAYNLAAELDEPLAAAELAHLCGSLYTRRHEYSHAYDYHSLCVAAVRAAAIGPGSLDHEIEASGLIGQAGCDFIAARYDECQRRIDEARRILGRAPEVVTAAVIEWLQAGLQRWRGEPERAVRTAMAAAEALAIGRVGAWHARILHVVAASALDLAETYGAQPPALARRAWLRMARSFQGRALQIARRLREGGIEGHALLARARWERLRGAGTDNSELIREVIARADSLDDPILLAEARTALGDERAALGDLDGAAEAYREVVAFVRERDVPAMGVRARRALVRLGRDRV